MRDEAGIGRQRWKRNGGELFWGRSTDRSHPWLTFLIFKIESQTQLQGSMKDSRRFLRMIHVG
jgi:hypothetical protein